MSDSATPLAATPIIQTDSGFLATRVAELEENVVAQNVVLLELGLRVDELEQGLAPVLEGLPDQVLLTSFLQSQLDDLQVRVGTLEELVATVVATSDHPLIGTWAVADETSDGVSGLVIFTAEGTVVVVPPGGGMGIGAWAPTGPRTAITVWLVPRAERDREGNFTALRSQITIDATGTTVAFAYAVLQVTARGGMAERSHGSVNGVRISMPTLGPVVAT
ncbi:MAG TPA: hypothetical protein VFT63_03250, partial [bacterium]|nr:hypothetical protein [bacterium]